MAKTQLNTYIQALIPERPIILGIHLRPYTLGHLFLMQRLGCGYASEDPEHMGTIEDLYLGVAICGRTYEDFLDWMYDDEAFNKWCKKWGEEVTKYLEDLEGDLNENIFMYYTTQSNRFKNYIQSSIIVPKYWETERGDAPITPSGAHWSQNILVTLMSELNYTFSEAVNMPISKALVECFKMAENRGQLTLMTDGDMELIEQTEKATT